MKRLQLTGLLEREGDGYVSLCPELDVASQGSTVEEALANLREAVELFLETVSPSEIEQRYHSEKAHHKDTRHKGFWGVDAWCLCAFVS